MEAIKTDIEILTIKCSECSYSWKVPLPIGAFPKGVLIINCENEECKEFLRLSPDGTTKLQESREWRRLAQHY